MQRREKILAAALGAVVALYVVGPMFSALFLEPLSSRNGDIAGLTLEVRAREDKEFDLMQATKRLGDWRDESLPPDPLNAQREYQEWLTELTQIAGWRDVAIKPGTRSSRSALFAPISVTIEARATLDQVKRLLEQLATTRVLQRVTQLDLESPSFDGNPSLSVTLTTEALALPGATERTRLFATTSLADPLAPDATTLNVRPASEFPAAPFRVRIDQELLDVTAVSKNGWQATRGVAGATPQPHAADAPVVHVPLRSPDQIPQYEPLLIGRLFVKPRDFVSLEPRIAAVDLSPAVRGKPWTAELRVENWDGSQGPPEFSLAEGAPAGLSIDRDSGTLAWSPPADAELRPYSVQVRARQSGAPGRPVEATFAIELRRPNDAPRLTIPDRANVWLGQPFALPLSAEDADFPEEKLTYALRGNLPDGLRVDAATGLLSWTPGIDTPLRDVPLEVTVTDAGVPPQTDTATLTLRLQDDAALYTKLVGCIGQGNNREAWLFDPSTNQGAVLHEGDEFFVADIVGQVVRIDPESIDVRSGDRLYRWAIGQNPREWAPLSDASPDVTPTGDAASDTQPAP